MTLDPALQKLLADRTGEASQGGNIAFPILNLFSKNSPNMPQVGVGLNVGGQWSKAALMPQMRDVFSARVMPGLFSFKSPKPWQPGQGAPNTMFLASGHNGFMAGDFMNLGWEANDALSGRGIGAAMYAHNFESPALSPTEISAPPIDASKAMMS